MCHVYLNCCYLVFLLIVAALCTRMIREMNMLDIPSLSHHPGINVVTYCSVVPMHAEMVVRKDIR